MHLASASVRTMTESTITYRRYDPAEETIWLERIRTLISQDLSEPYSIYVYRYFLYQWGDLCYMVSSFPLLDGRRQSSRIPQALQDDELTGVVVCKLEVHRGGPLRGYIAMLAVREQHRGKGIGELEDGPPGGPANSA